MNEKEIKEAEDKLKLIENGLKEKAEEIDGREASVKEQEENILKKEKKLLETLGVVDSSSSFSETVSIVNNLYNSYVAISGNDDGLIDTIQKIIDARKAFNN